MKKVKMREVLLLDENDEILKKVKIPLGDEEPEILALGFNGIYSPKYVKVPNLSKKAGLQYRKTKIFFLYTTDAEEVSG